MFRNTNSIVKHEIEPNLLDFDITQDCFITEVSNMELPYPTPLVKLPSPLRSHAPTPPQPLSLPVTFIKILVPSWPVTSAS